MFTIEVKEFFLKVANEDQAQQFIDKLTELCKKSVKTDNDYRFDYTGKEE